MNKRAIIEYAAVCLAYLIIGLAVTYPLGTELARSLYGLPGDGYGTLWSFWWNLNHPIDWSAPAQPTLLALAKILASWFGEVAAYNLILLAGYPLAGLAIYLIVRYFTADKAASAIAGLIYILGPYHIYQSYVHLSLSMIAWLPLYLYALLLWLQDPKYWRAVISGLLLALVILDNYYYGYLAVLLTGFFVIGLLVQILRRKLSFWTALGQGLIAASIAMAAVVPFLVPAFSSGAAETFTRPLRELFVFRAKWWDFFVPAISHPFVGRLIQETTRYELAGSNYFERTLYLGYLPLFLAVIGVWRTRRSWLTYFLLALFFTSLIMATAPALLASLLYDWFPTFRVYSRFGLLSLISTAILAGIGIATLSRGSRSWIFYAGVVIFLVIDFYPLVPSPKLDVTTVRPADLALASQPLGTTIVYPLASADEVRTNQYLADSRRFGQPLFNAIASEYHSEALREALENPEKETTLALLKRLKIRYILVRKDIYREGRLPASLGQFYDPDYPRYLNAWNGGNVPAVSLRPELIQIYSDKDTDLYTFRP